MEKKEQTILVNDSQKVYLLVISYHVYVNVYVKLMLLFSGSRRYLLMLKATIRSVIMFTFPRESTLHLVEVHLYFTHDINLSPALLWPSQYNIF